MAFRFWYEFTIGVITLISVLIFGQKGIVAIVPLALLPIIMRVRKIKADEREKYLFFKGTQYIVNAVVFLIIIGVFVLRLKSDDLSSINSIYLGIIAASLLIIISTMRLYLFYKR